MTAYNPRWAVLRRRPAAMWTAIRWELAVLDLRRRCWEEHRDVLIARVAAAECGEGDVEQAHAALEQWLVRDMPLLIACLVAELGARTASRDSSTGRPR